MHRDMMHIVLLLWRFVLRNAFFFVTLHTLRKSKIFSTFLACLHRASNGEAVLSAEALVVRFTPFSGLQTK